MNPRNEKDSLLRLLTTITLGISGWALVQLIDVRERLARVEGHLGIPKTAEVPLERQRPIDAAIGQLFFEGRTDACKKTPAPK